jgi:hypothetical protein
MSFLQSHPHTTHIYPEDGCAISLRNVRIHLKYNTASQLRRPKYEQSVSICFENTACSQVWKEEHLVHIEQGHG